MEVKRTSFNMPIDIHNKLKMLAIAKKTTQSQLIEEYLREGIEKDKEALKKLID
jgi:predicted DNA-binding protein